MTPKLHVTTYRNPNTGETLVMHADVDPERLAKNTASSMRLHRVLAVTRFHRLAGMRRYPVDFASVATEVYEPSISPEDGTS